MQLGMALSLVLDLGSNGQHGFFETPAAEVVSHFNRLSPESPGGSSLLAVVQGTDVDPDPFGLRLWKHGQLFV